MKRTLALLLALVMALTIFAGCSRKEPPAETEPPEESTQPTDAAVTPDYDPEDVTPAMWKVTDSAGHTMYLFGTIHVGDQRSETAMEKIAPTLDACDALALEFDLKEYERDTQMQMNTVMTFLCPDDTKVTDEMPEELFERCKDLLQDAEIYHNALKSYNLQFWSTLVDQAVLELYTDLSSDYAMDSQLCDRAYDNEQPVISVESAQAQMDLLNSVPDELAIAMIEETLDGTDSYNENLTEMYALWLSGSADELAAFLEDEDEPDPERYSPELIAMAEAYDKAMTADRNDGMFLKAQELLASGQTVFFAVGAAHIIGEHGLVQLLTNAGYTVERYDYEA